MHLKGKISAITPETVVLALEDGQSLDMPRRVPEGELKIGQEMVVVGFALGGELAGKQELARHLLNEILIG